MTAWSVLRADEAGLTATWRLVRRDDRGALTEQDGGFLFHGRDGTVVMRDVERIDVVQPTPPWAALALLAAGTVAAAAAVLSAWPAAVVFVLIAGLVAWQAVALAYATDLWVAVRCADGSAAYFAAASPGRSLRPRHETLALAEALRQHGARP